jgi:hypothetical protein
VDWPWIYECNFVLLEKKRSKIRKILLRSLLLLVFLMSVLAVLTRNRWVQTRISQYFADEISQSLGVEVSIQGVEVDFLRNFHFEGFLMKDLHLDTMIYGRTLDFRISDWNMAENEFKVNHLDAFGLLFRMGNYDGEEKFNYEYVFLEDSSQANVPLKLTIDDVSLHQCEYVFFSGTNAHEFNKNGEFNPSYLSYKQVDASVSGFNLNDQGIVFMEVNDLATLDRSGQKIDKISTQLTIDGPNLEFQSLEILTGQTKIIGSLGIKELPGSKGTYFDKFNYQLRLIKSNISLSDIGYYAPYLKTHQANFKVTADVFGPLSNLSSTNVRAVSDQGSNLTFDYKCKGIPEVSNMEHWVTFKSSRFSSQDISRFFKQESWVDELKPVGSVYLDGESYIPYNGFQHQGTLRTDAGSFIGKHDINYGHLDSTLPYSFDGQIGNVVLQPWVDSKLIADEISGRVNIETDLFHILEHAKFNAENASFQLNGQMVANNRMEAEILSGAWKLNWDVNHEYLGLKLNGFGHDLFTENQELEFDGDLKRLDLRSFGLDSINSRYSGEFELRFTGNDIDNIRGNLGVHFARFIRGNTEFQLQHQIITRPDDDLIGFKGDWLDGTITGPLKISNTKKWLQQVAHSMAPERFEELTDVLTDSVYLDLHLPQTAWIEEFLMPGLYLGPLAIRGHYFARNNTTDMQIGPLSLEYGKMYMEKAVFNLKKPRKNGFLRSSFSSNYVLIENTLYDTLSLSAEVYNGGFQIATNLHDKSNRYSFQLKGNGSIQKKTANLYFTETELKIYDQIWQLDRLARVNFKPNSIQIQNFLLADSTHFVQIEGKISDYDSDTLHLDFGNITPRVLTPFFAFHTFDSFGFSSYGNLDFCALTDEPQFFGDLKINGLTYQNQSFGSVEASLSQTRELGKVNFNSTVRSGPMDQTRFNGAVQFKRGIAPQLAITGSIPYGSRLNVLGPFLEGVISIDSLARFGADMRITGSAYKPVVKGLLQTNKFGVGIDYLGTTYRTGGNFKITETGLYTMRPLKFTDPSTGRSAWMKLGVSHDNFSDFALDLYLDSIKNMRVLKTTEQMNDMFYGDAWADGKAHIYGLFSEIDMDIELKAREKTKVAIQYPDVTENNIVGSVIFKNKRSTQVNLKTQGTKTTNEEEDALGQIALDIEATPDAEVSFVIDKQLGDIISGNGNGSLRLIYGRDESLSLFGRYIIDKGDYTFSLPGINLLKKINLKRGGDIRWDGDPFNAVVNLSGSFEKKISPSTLMISTGNTGASYPATRFVSVLNMEGNLFSPQISFDLQAPDLNSTTGASASEVNSVLQRIRSNRDETTRQSIALLLFGNFLPPSFAGAAAPSAGTFSSAGFAGNSISTLASNVVNDLFSKYGIPTRIQVNIDDVRNSTGTSNTQLFVNSEWFLSDRLRLDLNYDPTVAVLVNSVAVPLNFNLEYKTSDENWRLKAFSRSNNLILEQNTGTTTNGVSGNTLGTGVLYRREFDTFKRKKDPNNDAQD